MTQNGVKTRMVYDDAQGDGEDVVVEYVSTDGDNTPERTRVYWLLPEIDQRLGFVDIEGTQKTYYYYICDQVGSVLQVVDENGNVKNQYHYDAFGNVDWLQSYETVPNRYLFQGREWDAVAGHYHFRNRIYSPEWGLFSGPDMNLANGPLGEPHGMMSYVAFGNNPVDVTDAMGLEAWYAADHPEAASMRLEAESCQGMTTVPRKSPDGYPIEGDDAFAKRLLETKTNKKAWGPIYPSEDREPVKPATKNTTAAEILSSTTGNLYIFSHSMENGLSVNITGDQKTRLTPETVKAIRHGGQGGTVKVKYVWTDACSFGEHAKEWHEAFGATVFGSRDTVRVFSMAVLDFRPLSFWEDWDARTKNVYPYDQQAIENEFGVLMRKLTKRHDYVDRSGKTETRLITYEEFVREWKNLLDRHKDALRGAYWHFYVPDYYDRDAEKRPIWVVYPDPRNP